MSRFNFFGKQTSPTANTPTDPDELAHLDIHDELFPAGYPDEYSPSAFKNIQLNAEGLLRRYQQAHREQKQALRSLGAQRTAQADELEAEQMRNEHLKLQLEDMAQKAAEQEMMINNLKAQLTMQEAPIEPRDAQSTIRMISEESMPSDESETPRSRYRRNRSSDISTSGESETGSEVSSVVSVFSEALSVAPSHASTVSSPVTKSGQLPYPLEGCQKCHGVRSTEAWDVIGMMKMESAVLKQRISQLENAQDDALDFLSGLNFR